MRETDTPMHRMGRWAVAVWNGRCPAGTPVHLMEDDGSVTETRTRSAAWQLGHGQPVVLVEGRTGGYSLWRLLLPPGKLDEVKP